MAQIKCIDCGQVFNDTLKECPKCGCPVNECDVLNPTILNNSDKMGDTETRNASNYSNVSSTTDTGYLNEKAVAGYADFVFICASVGGVALYIAILIIVARFAKSVDAAVGVYIFGAIVLAIYIILLYIAKAFIKIYANISINLHEINMKLK